MPFYTHETLRKESLSLLPKHSHFFSIKVYYVDK